jgi:small subunit ribosomal protein S17
MKGIVVSNKMTNALTVTVSRSAKHAIYKKTFKLRKKYHASCSDSSKFHLGAEVEIVSCRPISKTISHIVVEK